MPVGSVDARLRLIYNDILRSDTNVRRCVPLGRVAGCNLAVIQFNCLYVFASYTVLVLNSKCVTVAVIGGWF
jgi:hypothetical protein